MKVILVGQRFDKNLGQGVYVYSENVYENLKKININTEKIEMGLSNNPYKTILLNFF